jgi:hypothetical protein
MADNIFKWIRNVSALNDEQLKQEIDLVHQSSIKAFARALSKVRRPEVDTHTLRKGTLAEHDFADTINLLLSIGEQTITAINSNVPVSPFPYNVSTHMDVNSRIKVLTRRITVHKSEIPSGRDTSSQATHLQLRQFIGQDLAALELCFENQKDFNDYTTKHFNWKYAMCHLYIVYYRFMNDYPMFVYSGLPWTTIRNECTKWRRWLDSDEAKTLSTDNYSSSSFWKGTLPPYREAIDIDDNSIASPDSFHSIEDDGERDDNQSAQDDMILSGSIVNLNIQ